MIIIFIGGPGHGMDQSEICLDFTTRRFIELAEILVCLQSSLARTLGSDVPLISSGPLQDYLQFDRISVAALR